MNENELSIIRKRIAKHIRLQVWNIKRLKECIALIDADDFNTSEEMALIEKKVIRHENRIAECNKQIAWNTKRLAKCQNDIIAP